MSIKTKSKKKKVIISLICILILAGAGIVARLFLFSSAHAENTIENNAINVQPLANHDLSTSITATGTIESQNIVVVTTDLTSKVKELPVSLGEHVKKGQTLCVFDTTEIKEQIHQIESQISESEKAAAKQKKAANQALNQAKAYQKEDQKAADSAVSDAKAAYNKALQTQNEATANLEQLKKNPETDPAIIEEASSKLDEANSSVNAASEALLQAKSNRTSTIRSSKESVQSAKNALNELSSSGSDSQSSTSDLSKLYRQLDESKVIAEQEGIITSLNIAQGGVPNGTLMQIEDDKHQKVKIKVKEKDIMKIKDGMAATITADALPDTTCEGTISQVINFASSQSDENSDSENNNTDSSYSANINIANESPFLLGMSVKTSIVTQNIGEKLSVPYDAIQTDESGNSSIYTAIPNKDNTYSVKKKSVTIGESNDYYTAVSGDDLKEGDLIILMPDSVQDGETIDNVLNEGDEMPADDTPVEQ